MNREEKFQIADMAIQTTVEKVLEHAPADFTNADLASAFLSAVCKLYVAELGFNETANHLRRIADGLCALEVSEKMKKH